METKISQETIYSKIKYDLDILIKDFPDDIENFARWYYSSRKQEKPEVFLCSQLARDIYDEAQEKGEDHEDLLEIRKKVNEFIMSNLPF